MPGYTRYESNSAYQYPEIRKVFGSQYRTPEDIEALLESADIDPEYMENFLSTLRNVGRSVVGALPSILPAAGTVLGTAVGGPVGGAVGGTLGSAARGAWGDIQRPTRPLRAPSPGIQQAPQLTGEPTAVAQLLQVIFRPEVLQALIAMLLGQAGARNIPVGNTAAPPGAFTNMISTLANQASAEYNAAVAADGETVPGYLLDFAGEVQGDIAVPENRAHRLREILQEVDYQQDASYRDDVSELLPPDDWVSEEMALTQLYSGYEAR